jgi:hypothetical protein
MLNKKSTSSVALSFFRAFRSFFFFLSLLVPAAAPSRNFLFFGSALQKNFTFRTA